MMMIFNIHKRKNYRSDRLKPNAVTIEGILSLYPVPLTYSFPTEGEAGSLRGRSCNAVSDISHESTIKPSTKGPVPASTVTMHWTKGNTQTSHKLQTGSEMIVLSGALSELLLSCIQMCVCV